MAAAHPRKIDYNAGELAVKIDEPVDSNFFPLSLTQGNHGGKSNQPLSCAA